MPVMTGRGWKLVSQSLPWFLVVSDRAVDTMGSAKQVSLRSMDPKVLAF